MKFECGDLERALAVSELMPEAREHLKHCAECRREYRVWNEVSTAAKGLHEEWESPLLWPAIRRSLEAEEKLKPRPLWGGRWKAWCALAAGVLLVAGLLVWTRVSGAGAEKRASIAAQSNPLASGGDFLTEQALAEVERTETAYRQSIERLSKLAEPRLQKPVSPVAVTCREKLLMLDAAISETRSNLDQNRFNVRLRMDLAALYREKQQALKELLTGEQKN
jgi:hypothetical protein